jgi:hypothetical protein
MKMGHVETVLRNLAPNEVAKKVKELAAYCGGSVTEICFYAKMLRIQFPWTNQEENLLSQHIALRTPRSVLYSEYFPHRTKWAVERRIADLRRAGRIPAVDDCDPPLKPGQV